MDTPILEYGQPDSPDPEALFAYLKPCLLFASCAWVVGVVGSFIVLESIPRSEGDKYETQMALPIVLALVHSVGTVIAWICGHILQRRRRSVRSNAAGWSIFGGAVYGFLSIFGTILERTPLESKMVAPYWIGLIVLPILFSFWMVRPKHHR